MKSVIVIVILLIVIYIISCYKSSFGVVEGGQLTQIGRICKLSSDILNRVSLLSTKSSQVFYTPLTVTPFIVGLAIYAGPQYSKDSQIADNYQSLFNLVKGDKSTIDKSIKGVILSGQISVNIMVQKYYEDLTKSPSVDSMKEFLIAETTKASGVKNPTTVKTLIDMKNFYGAEEAVRTNEAAQFCAVQTQTMLYKYGILTASEEPGMVTRLVLAVSSLTERLTPQFVTDISTWVSSVKATFNEAFSEIMTTIWKSLGGEYAEQFVAAGMESTAELLGVEVTTLSSTLTTAASGAGLVLVLFQLGTTLADIIGKYCPCDHPKRETHGGIPICYKGTCEEEFGENMHINGIDPGACALNCHDTYGKCYYNNGSWCANTGAVWNGCWGKSPARANNRSQRDTRPIQALKPNCRFNLDAMHSACSQGYAEMCPGLTSQPLFLLYYVFVSSRTIILSKDELTQDYIPLKGILGITGPPPDWVKIKTDNGTSDYGIGDWIRLLDEKKAVPEPRPYIDPDVFLQDYYDLNDSMLSLMAEKELTQDADLKNNLDQQLRALIGVMAEKVDRYPDYMDNNKIGYHLNQEAIGILKLLPTISDPTELAKTNFILNELKKQLDNIVKELNKKKHK